jgi:hypothetical protein
MVKIPHATTIGLLLLCLRSPSHADETQRKELARWLVLHSVKGSVKAWPELRPSSGLAFRSSRAVYVKLDKWPETKTLSIPRLNNIVSKVYLLGRSKTELSLQVEPQTWSIALPALVPTGDRPVIVLETGTRPHVPSQPEVVAPEADGTFVLPARKGITHGEALRFEPQPHKNTLGYWVDPSNWAQWHIEVKTAGTYAVHIFQGCGTGHGGSEVTIAPRPLGASKSSKAPPIRFTVEETGHFQNFVARTVGTLTVQKPGVYTLDVRPAKMAAGAVMDLRLIVLTRNPE